MADELSELHTSFHERVLSVMDLTAAAVRQLSSYPQFLNLMKAVRARRAHMEGSVDDPSIDEQAEEDLRLVEKERTHGFTLFYGLATIAIWSALEACVRDIVLGYLAIEPPFDLESVRKIRTTVGDYESMDQTARLRFIVDSLERDFAREQRKGVGRFESVLGAVGLGGSISPDVRASLLELSEVRHALVHRSGMADQKLISNCPWINHSPGERIIIKPHSMTLYALSSLWYGSDVFARILSKLGRPNQEVQHLNKKTLVGIVHPSQVWNESVNERGVTH